MTTFRVSALPDTTPGPRFRVVAEVRDGRRVQLVPAPHLRFVSRASARHAAALFTARPAIAPRFFPLGPGLAS